MPGKKRKCSECNRSKRPGLFSYRKTICNSCYRKSPAYRAQRDRYLQAKYGLTVDQYEKLEAASGGTCWTCGGKSGSKHLAVDHNHENGRVRGLLCKRCNSILARIFNRPDIALMMYEYLVEDGDRVRLVLGDFVLTPDASREV